MKFLINLKEVINFVNIGPKEDYKETYFVYKKKDYKRNILFDLMTVRSPPSEEVFYHILGADSKLVYIMKENVVFSISCSLEIQTMLIEAIMEHFIEEFFESFDPSVFSVCYGDYSCEVFDSFGQVVIDTFKNYEDLDLIKVALVTCRGCKKTLKIIIKKSLIEDTDKRTVPIVYIHSGHATLVYIDRDYKVRGHEIVSVSY